MVIDAMKGYHQCTLDEKSQALMTFITPFGRYKYLRAPYGLSSITEHYNRRMAEAFEGLTGFRRIVDDIVIYDRDEASHMDHVRQWGIFITVKPFKFSVLSTAHVRNLGAHVYRKFNAAKFLVV